MLSGAGECADQPLRQYTTVYLDHGEDATPARHRGDGAAALWPAGPLGHGGGRPHLGRGDAGGRIAAAIGSWRRVSPAAMCCPASARCRRASPRRAPQSARAVDFYRGKTLTVIVGFAPGGGVDTTAPDGGAASCALHPRPARARHPEHGRRRRHHRRQPSRPSCRAGRADPGRARPLLVRGRDREKPGRHVRSDGARLCRQPRRGEFHGLHPVEHRHQEFRRAQGIAQDPEFRIARQQHADRHDPDHACGQRRADQGRSSAMCRRRGCCWRSSRARSTACSRWRIPLPAART